MWKVHVIAGGRESSAVEITPGTEKVVGRDPAVDIVVGERSVSRRHCRLIGTSEGVEVVDLGSANGVYFGGRPISRIVAKHGDEVQIGMVQLRITRGATKTGMIPIQGLHPAPGEEHTTSSSSTDSSRSMLDAAKPAYKSLEKERLALLIEAGKSLSSTLELDQLLERIMDHLFQILPVRRAVLALIEPDGSLKARYMRPPGEARELSGVSSQHIIRQAIEDGTPRIIEDASLDQRLNQAHSILAANIKAALCAPLVSHTRCVGALYADYPGRARLYTQSDLDFIGAFASLAAVALDNSRMQSELRERERLQRDLEIAAEIQKALLPDGSQEIPGVEMDWAYWPARQVGGDFYDCLAVDGDRLALVLGDVSGKSIGAAMFMARLTSFLRATVPENPAPGVVLTRINTLLGTRADQVLFATACYILLHPAGRNLRYASAGHLPVLILEPGAQVFRELNPTGIPLGIDPSTTYAGQEEVLVPGSLLVLYTDGVVEARDAGGAMFGTETMKRTLLQNRDRAPREITQNLISAVGTHCEGSPYVRDDIAIMVVRLLS
jgi:serine phosphatase RsbU (regulator of sigma subunit)